HSTVIRGTNGMSSAEPELIDATSRLCLGGAQRNALPQCDEHDQGVALQARGPAPWVRLRCGLEVIGLSGRLRRRNRRVPGRPREPKRTSRTDGVGDDEGDEGSEEHTSELQSLAYL